MLPHYTRTLPIHYRSGEIIAALREHQVVIVAGETGSGKSTILPLLCLQAGFGRSGRIAVTQPRRIAAVTLAKYVASLDNTPVGATIGFQIRYRKQTGKSTTVVYMTDGVLLSSIAGDPLLERYEVIIIDEAHERSMNIDFLLGYLRLLLPKRPELRCIIASATLDTKLFSRMFNHAPVITVAGRKFTVEIHYRPVIELWKGYRIDSFIEGSVAAAQEICANNKQGDILIFFPTVDDVVETVNRLRARIREPGIRFLPLHSRLAPHCQKEVFERHTHRKIVAATNIAETSLTVPGIRFVIDTGLVRMLRYEPSASLSRMPVEKVSRASADQRAGRCGREGDGVCIRLYSEQDYLSRPRFTLPEIKRTNLAGVILRIHALDAGNPGTFPFPQRPSAAAMVQGYCQLQELGALDRKRGITRFGRAMARFPLDPQVACMLLRAERFGAVPEVMAITAALSVQEPLEAAQGGEDPLVGVFRHPMSDFMTYLNVWKKLQEERNNTKRLNTVIRNFARKYRLQEIRLREWIDAHEHLRRICREIPGFGRHRTSADASYEAIHKSLLAGLPGGIACRKDQGVYEGLSASEIRIASSSVTARKEYPWLLFHEIVQTDRVYGRRAAAIDPKWVEQLFADRCRRRHENPWYDPLSGTVRVREEVTYRTLSLIRNRVVDCHEVDRPLAREVFVREALIDGAVGEQYRFIRCNREAREKVASAERKLRKRLYAGDHAIEAFYEERAPVATRRELEELLRQRGNDSSLIIPLDVLLIEPLPSDIGEYGDEIVVASHHLPLVWEHAPESPADGATVKVPQELADALPQYYWEWQPPILRSLRTELLVSRITSALLAKRIDPADAVDRIKEHLTIPDGPWTAAVRKFLIDEFGIAAGDAVFDPCSYPQHLWLRVHAVDSRGIITSAYRPPLSMRRKAAPVRSQPVPALHALAKGVIRNASFLWDEAPLLQPVACGSTGQKVPCQLFPALHKKDSGVVIGVFATRNAALTAHAEAITNLLEERLAEQLTWEIEAVQVPAATARRARQCGFSASLHDLIVRLLIRNTLRLPDDLPRSAAAFEDMVERAVRSIPTCTAAVINVLDRTFEGLSFCSRYLEKRKLRQRSDFYKPLFSELENALNGYRDALTDERYPIDHVMQLPKYLDAFPLRCNAAMLDVAKYRSAMREVGDSRRIIDATANMDDFLTGIRRRQLLAVIEQYCIDIFSGAIKRGSGATPAGMVVREYLALQRAVEEFYRE